MAGTSALLTRTLTFMAPKIADKEISNCIMLKFKKLHDKHYIIDPDEIARFEPFLNLQ